MIDEARLARALHRIKGFEALTGCERLSTGASRETYRLTARIDGNMRLLALRRSPSDETPVVGGGPRLDDEARLFSAARAAGAPGPQILLQLVPEDGLGAGIVMEWIEGETLGARIARAPEFAPARRILAHQCGEVLARLHAIDVRAEGIASFLDAFDAEHTVRKTHAAYLELETPQPMIDYLAMWLLANLPEGGRMTLVHGDFRNGNLIVDPETGIRAVLDWELAHIGDPMRDLGWLITRSWRFGVSEKPVGGFGEISDLIAGYEAVSGQTVNRKDLLFWEVFGSFWWSVSTLSMGQSFRDGSEPSVERPAIGRRSSECQIDAVNILIPGPARLPAAAPVKLSATSLPRTDELVRSVRDFLRTEAAQALKARTLFLARVAANALDIVLRELEFGAEALAWEQAALRQLLNREGAAGDLREALCRAIRAGDISLESPDLQAYLRSSVLAQVMIDQPGYPGAVEAAKRT